MAVPEGVRRLRKLELHASAEAASTQSGHNPSLIEVRRDVARLAGQMARFWTRESVALLLVAVLASASAYEAAVALEWISLGSAPGEAPSGEGFVRMIAMVGMLVGAGYCASVALRARSSV